MPASARCLYCNSESSWLFYYTKEYPAKHGTRTAIESPMFSCASCATRARCDLDVCRGGIEGIKGISFRQLGMMREKEIVYLTSKRGYERNELATKEMRQLLFSLHYRNRPSKKDILLDALEWAEKAAKDEYILAHVRALKDAFGGVSA